MTIGENLARAPGSDNEFAVISRSEFGAKVRAMVGILVHGNNHFILSGPRPTEEEALALVRNWSVIQIGKKKSQRFEQWEIREKEFRENLGWAVTVPGDRNISPAAAKLLTELEARGVPLIRCSGDPFGADRIPNDKGPNVK
jgi:hypothetical protein